MDASLTHVKMVVSAIILQEATTANAMTILKDECVPVGIINSNKCILNFVLKQTHANT